MGIRLATTNERTGSLMDDDFYADWDPKVQGGEPKPTTVEQKINFGVGWYSGDSGVSQEELEEYLRDLVKTAHDE